MINFKTFYWLNAMYFIIFGVVSTILLLFFTEISTTLFWGAFMIFMNLVVLIGEYVSWKKHKKNNSNDFN